MIGCGLLLGAAAACASLDGLVEQIVVSVAFLAAGPLLLLSAIVTLRLAPDFRVFPCRATGCVAISLLVAAGAMGSMVAMTQPMSSLLASGHIGSESAAGLVAVATSIAMPVIGAVALLEALAARRAERQWTNPAKVGGEIAPPAQRPAGADRSGDS